MQLARDISCCITINDIVSKIRSLPVVVAPVHQGDEITNLYMTCHGEEPSKQASIAALIYHRKAPKALGLGCGLVAHFHPRSAGYDLHEEKTNRLPAPLAV